MVHKAVHVELRLHYGVVCRVVKRCDAGLALANRGAAHDSFHKGLSCLLCSHKMAAIVPAITFAVFCSLGSWATLQVSLRGPGSRV